MSIRYWIIFSDLCIFFLCFLGIKKHSRNIRITPCLNPSSFQRIGTFVSKPDRLFLINQLFATFKTFRLVFFWDSLCNLSCLRKRLKKVILRLTNNDWKPFFKNNMLIFCHIDLPCFLVDLIIGPTRVDTRQLCRNSVVFSHEQRVENNKIQLLIDTEVSSEEAIIPLAAANVASRHFAFLLPCTRWKIVGSASTLTWHFQLSTITDEIPGLFECGSVNIGAINPVSDLVQLFSGGKFTF